MKTSGMKTYRREYMRKWREENRERSRAAGRKSNAKHKAALAAKRALPENRAKANARAAAWRGRLGANERRNRRLLHQYNITLEDYRRMIGEQDNFCPICNRLLAFLQPHVDHDHETGEVRAILCSACNQAVGMLRENPRVAERLAKYLRKHGKQ